MSLKTRIFCRTLFLLVLLVTCISFTMGFFAFKRNRRQQKDIARENVLFLAKRCKRLILWDDRVALKSLFSEAITGKKNVSYAWVERDRKPYVHTFAEGVPKGLYNLHKEPVTGCSTKEVTSDDGVNYFDFALPIEQTNAILHVGVSVREIDQTVYGLLETILVISLAVIILGAFLSERIASFTTKEVAEMTEALETAREKAEAAMESKSKFLSHISHEIRSPLNTITGMTYLLFNSDLSREQNKYVDTILKAGNSMMAIINDLFDYSRIESRQLDLEIYDFDLRIMVEDATEMHACRSRQKGIDFNCTIDPHVPAQLHGDPGRLRRVLSNIIGNSIRYTEEGSILVEVKRECENKNDVTLRFTINDSGIGMPPELVKVLQQSLSREGVIIPGRDPGVGFGFSISKQLVEMMNGTMGVESDESVGTTAWFTVVLGKTGEDIKSFQETCNNIPGTRAIIVNDNPMSRYVLKEQLKSLKIESEETANREEALEKLKLGVENKSPFRIIFIDKDIPGKGAELGKEIRKQDEFSDTIMIMLTAAGERGDASRMQKIGFSAYLTMPVKNLILYNCMQTVLAKPPSGIGAERTAQIITRHSLAEDRKRRIRILLAEDFKDNQGVTEKVIKKLGYRVNIFSSGKEAAMAIKKDDYDFVLLDLELPELNDAELAEINSKAESSSIPVVALVAGAKKKDHKRELPESIKTFVSKPVELKKLSGIIENQLNLSFEIKNKKSSISYSEKKKSFDRENLINRLEGDEELLKQLLDVMLKDLPKRIEKFKEAIADGDSETVECEARTLKSMAANMETCQLRETAFAIEIAGKEKNLDKADNLLAELELQFGLLKEITQEE